MMSWILDLVPWWLWYVLIGGAAIATMPLWLPIARGIWAVLPNWARLALGGVAAGIAAYLAGRNRGRANERERQKLQDAKAIKGRLEVEREVDRMDKPTRKKETEKWLRD